MTNEELIKAALEIKQKCRTTHCLECPFYCEKWTECVIEGLRPSDWDVYELGGENQ